MFEFQQSSFPTAFLPRESLKVSDALATSILTNEHSERLVFSPTSVPGPRVLREIQRSKTLDELRRDPVYGRLWHAVPEQITEPNPAEIARDDRLAILARKYEGGALTREDEARVAILTQRLRRLVPRVTRLSWTIAEDALTRLEALSASVDQIGEKYGL